MKILICHDEENTEFVKNYKVGDVVKKEIRSIADFGLFVGFENNIDGIIHISEISWEAKPEKYFKIFRIYYFNNFNRNYFFSLIINKNLK